MLLRLSLAVGLVSLGVEQRVELGRRGQSELAQPS